MLIFRNDVLALDRRPQRALALTSDVRGVAEFHTILLAPVISDALAGLCVCSSWAVGRGQRSGKDDQGSPKEPGRSLVRRRELGYAPLFTARVSAHASAACWNRLQPDQRGLPE